MAYGMLSFTDMLMEDDCGFESMNTTVSPRTAWYTAPTTAADKMMRMAAFDGRQKRFHERAILIMLAEKVYEFALGCSMFNTLIHHASS